MIELFSAIQLANLAPLLTVALTPLLILAYLRRKNRRQRVVSSVIILQKLRRKRLLHRRFKPPLRFFLELLALLLLATAMTQPSLRDQATRVALVFDTSLSMRAKDLSSPNHQTRFALAMTKADKWLKAQNFGSTYTLFVSSPRLKQIGDKDLSSTSIRGLLNSLRPSFASDSLDTSIIELAESTEFDRLVIFTDRQVDYASSTLEPKDDVSTRLTSIDVHSVAKPAVNAYLADLQIVQSDVDQSNKHVLVSLGLSGEKPLDLKVHLSRISRDHLRSAQSYQQLASTRTTVDPQEQTQVTFDLPSDASPDDVYRVELFPDDSRQAMTSNALAEDDSAWVALHSSGSFRILLVSPQESADALGLQNIQSFTIEQLSPERYTHLDNSELEQYALIIFHRSSPAVAPHRPSLLILPPANNLFFPVIAETTEARISFWAEDHPLTSYLRVPLLKPSRSTIFDVPLWGQAVINVEQGAILVAGESRGIRFAAVGMEILPFEGASTPTLSILALNLIHWLAGRTELISGSLTGGSIRLEGGQNWVINSPKQEVDSVEVPDNDTHFYTLHTPGPYLLSGVSRKAGSAGKRSTQLVTANNFYPLESSTFQTAYLVVPGYVNHEKEESKANLPLWNYLLAGVFALLVLEILLYFFGVGGNAPPAQGDKEVHEAVP